MFTKIGFTGPRSGMSDEQGNMLHLLLKTLKDVHNPHATMEFFHGDCVGADEEAHHIAHFLGYRITVFPPLNPGLRAFCEADEVLPAKDYLERDRDIVNLSDVLLAAVNMPPKPRSGSWYTYKYAQERFKRAWLL